MNYEAIISNLCDCIIILLVALPVVFYMGVEHERRAAFRRYEQARMAYTAQRIRDLNK